MSNNGDIEEILSLKCVDVYHLNFNRNDNHYDVTAVTNRAALRVFRSSVFTEKSDAVSNRLALIKCKDWYYPLESDVTHVYRCVDAANSYLFNDSSSADALTIVVLNDVDDSKVLLFENILLLYASISDSPHQWKHIITEISLSSQSLSTRNEWSAEPLSQPQYKAEAQPLRDTNESYRRESTAETVAKNLVNGAHVINNGITKGTQIASGLVVKGAQHIKANQEPTRTPRPVDPRVASGLQNLRSVSQTACSVTGACVSAVAKGTHSVGQWAAPHVKKHGTSLISSISGKNDSESGKVMDNIFTVASGGLQGFATLYHGVTENAKILGKTVANETVDIVNNRYGNEAGKATEDVLYSVGNAAITLQNVEQLGPKAIAKKAALDTGKNVITNNNERPTKDDESQRKTNSN